MRAIVIHQPGAASSLRCEHVPDPTPGRRDVVIKVARCGVCFHEVVVRNGTLRQGVELPCIPGHEIAGEVVAVGADVRQVRVGDRVATTQRYHVCGQCRLCRTGRETLCAERRFLGDAGMVGGYAELVAVEEDNVALIPEGVAMEHAAIAACTVGTILNAVREVGAVRPGERVLVTGAGGGLGMHAVQLAKLAGAEVVALTTSPEKAAQVRDLGADIVVVGRRGEDFSIAVRDATAGHGVDVAIDTVGTPVFHGIRRSMATGGRWVLIGQLTGETIPFNPAQLFLHGISMLSATSTTREQLRDSLRLLARKQVRPIVSGVLPLEAAAQAHEALERGATLGRLLLDPAAAPVVA
jgi:acryloyl-coenzyme A reductase